jgi:esterase/lipase superfamily enzyme
MWRWLGTFCLLGGLFLFPRFLLGAEISEFLATPDGSIDPPGDVLEVLLHVGDADRERKIEVELTGYLVSERGEQRILPAKGDFADGKGQYRVRRKVLPAELRVPEPTKPPPEDDIAAMGRWLTSQRPPMLRFVVPFAQLRVPKGRHRVGYVARLFVDARPVDQQASRLCWMEVGDAPREYAKVTVRTYGPQMDAIPEHTWSAKGKLSPLRYRMEPRPVEETKMAAVHIANGYFRSELGEAAGDPNKSAAIALTKDWVDEPRRTIHFATNRQVANRQGNLHTLFGNQTASAIADLKYGTAVVSIPFDAHTPGIIERPGVQWLFWRETPDPNQHFLVEKWGYQLTADQFRKSLGADDVLLYVHGFNNTFEESLLRGGQLQHDLKFPGKLAVFSWPSAGATIVSIDSLLKNPTRLDLAYKEDLKQAGQSAPFLKEYLLQLTKKPDGSRRKVHVIAHSMGNRVLLQALRQLEADDTFKNGPLLGQVVLAAADYTAIEMTSAVVPLTKSCERITYYYSSCDGALTASRVVNGTDPMGMWAWYDKKADTISAEALTTAFVELNHQYSNTCKPVLDDLRMLLGPGHPAPVKRRPPIGTFRESPQMDEQIFWTFQAN